MKLECPNDVMMVIRNSEDPCLQEACWMSPWRADGCAQLPPKWPRCVPWTDSHPSRVMRSLG